MPKLIMTKPLSVFRILALVAALCILSLYFQVPQPDGAGAERGILPTHWIAGGPKCMEESEWQIHEYNADLYILRESGCTHYEKPFLYVVSGNDKATLIDTGAGENDSGRIFDQVVHTHGLSDHIAGDPQNSESNAVARSSLPPSSRPKILL